MYSLETINTICPAFRLNEGRTNDKLVVCTAFIEITRRCNLSCVHCMKGDAQPIDILPEYIDSFMSQFDLIYALAFGGGEPTLAPDLIRYTLNSAKRHGVRIGRVVIITNGTVKSEDFLSVFRDFSNYTLKPEYNRILISNDRFHRFATGITPQNYEEIKTYFEDNGRNIVEFQDNTYNLVRVGNCAKKEDFKIQPMREAMEQGLAYRISQEKSINKFSLRHNGRYFCNLELTATGHILQRDEITYLDEDNPRYYNGDVTDTIKAIVQSENQDPYFEKFGDYLRMLQDLQEIGRQLQESAGFGGFKIVFGGKKKVSEIVSILRSLKEIKERIDNLTPIVKSSLSDLNDTERNLLREVIDGLEKSNEMISRLDTALEALKDI